MRDPSLMLGKENEKRMMVIALRNCDGLRRGTGRTSKVVKEAVERVLNTRAPVVLIGVHPLSTRAMVLEAQVMIEDRLHGDSKSVEALVKGRTYGKDTDPTAGFPSESVFEDHTVVLRRAIEAVEGL